MTDQKYEEIIKAIHKCKDKTQSGEVCRMMCLPCERVIDSGKCPLIIEMLKEQKNEYLQSK